MWVLLAVSAALAWGAWAASSPAGSSPDDDFHLASIWCAGGAAQHAEPGQVCATAHGKHTAGSVSRVLPREVAQAACYRWLRLQPASCVRHIPPGNVAQVANDGLYPGGYYAVMHRVVSGSVTTSVMWIRGLNIGLALIVFGLAFAVSETRSRAALALTLGLAFCTPLGLFFIPSTNPTARSPEARAGARPQAVGARGGPSSTRGRYSTSWMRPSKVRCSIILRATSG